MTPEEQQQLANDVKATFTVFEPGARVYKWLEKLCLKYDQTFVPNLPDKSSFNAGAREIILCIDDKIMQVDKPIEQLDTINTEEFKE